MATLLTNLEKFIHHDDSLPRLVNIALAHAQFETIHPFLDGNGRIGRLLSTALMEYSGSLPEPLMYLSSYLKQYQTEYYRLLGGIRTKGDWESWVSFFLEGVTESATLAERGIIEVAYRVSADRRLVLISRRASVASLRLFELLPMMPRFTIDRIKVELKTTFPTANAAVKTLEELGIVTEITGRTRNRSFSYQPYIDLLSK